MTRCLASTLSLGGWCILSLPQSQSLSFLGVQQEHRLRCAMCLLWGADLWLRPSWWISTVQDPKKTWLAAGSLLTVCHLWGQDGPSPSGSGCRLPTSLPLAGGEASPQLARSPLVFAQSFVLPEVVPYSFLQGSSLSFFLFLSCYPTVWVAISP